MGNWVITQLLNYILMTTLIIGYGNPLRGDDGVGWRVVEVLVEQTAVLPLTLRTCHQLLPELAADVTRADGVIFVDAAVGDKPGQIFLQEVQPQSNSGSAFTHHLTPGGLLALAQDVYGRCPPARLLTVTGASFGMCDELSTAVAAALPVCIQQLQKLVAIK